jgi:RecG-like helicase
MNLEDIKGIGQTKKQLLNNINIFTAYDLLYNKPRSYEDRRQFETIQQAVNNNDNRASLVRVKVIEHKVIRNTKKKVLKIIVSDKTLNASLVCFNQNYLEKSFPIGIEIICLW